MLPAQRIQAYLEHKLQHAGHYTLVSQDGFTLYVHKTDPGFDANLIVPAPEFAQATALQRAVGRIRVLCEQHNRVPHFQFLDRAAPALRDYFAMAGARSVASQPVLLATPARIPEVNPPVDVSVDILSQSSSLDAVRVGLDTNALGFDPDAPRTTEHEAAAFREGLVNSRAFTLHWREQPVAAGMFTPIQAGVAELVGITTLGEFRRQGFARFLTAYMARAAFEAGADLVFLQAVSDAAAGVYTQAGFQVYANRLSYRVDTDQPS